ncbi:MAG: hypothetical protein IPK21_03940 [Haliscomenobacter sp.]|nr:hypothetical protein [Haliscomenobacter sp.]
MYLKESDFADKGSLVSCLAPRSRLRTTTTAPEFIYSLRQELHELMETMG